MIAIGASEFLLASAGGGAGFMSKWDSWRVKRDVIVVTALCAMTLCASAAVAETPRSIEQTGRPSLRPARAARATPTAGNRAKVAERTDRYALYRGDPALFGKVITGIRHEALHRTVPKVVGRELLIRVGEPLTRAALVETVQRLRNLGVFRVVTATLEASGPGVQVRLQYDEKWTLLPVFSFGGGGDRVFLSVGVQDIHLFHRLFRLSALYLYFSGTHSFSLQFDDPRLFDRRFHLSMYAAAQTRNRYVYSDIGTLRGMYSRYRDRVSATLWDRRDPQRVWSLNAQLLDDTYDVGLLTASERALNAAHDFRIPVAQRFALFNATMTFGRLDIDDFVVSGKLAQFSAGAGLGLVATSEHFGRASVTTRAAWALPLRGNLVTRAQVAATTSDAPEFQQFVGGLYNVRGFFEGRFSGRYMWLANVEYRLPSVHSRWLVLQHVIFVDVGTAGNDLNLFSRQPGIGLGVGGRLILPLIANFVARFDLTWFIEPNRNFDLERDWRPSFGSQQHF